MIFFIEKRGSSNRHIKMNRKFVTTLTVSFIFACRNLATPLFTGSKGNLASKEMVMEHDILLDEATLLPFLQNILKQAGFIEEKPLARTFHSLVAEGEVHTETLSNLLLPDDTSTAVFKAIEDCRRLRHSIREIKPILSFLIHGGRHEAKLLAKKFSTKLPIKRCRAILTIYCLPPTYFNGRAPRTRRFKLLTTN